MDTNNLIQIALQYKYHISKMGQKVWYIALCRITIASILGCNILRLVGEYKRVRRTSKNTQQGKKTKWIRVSTDIKNDRKEVFNCWEQEKLIGWSTI